MKRSGHDDEAVKITANTNTLKSVMEISNDFIVDFRVRNSIASVLGFAGEIYNEGTIYSFFPNVSPGFKIVENPRNLVYLPVILDKISKMETVVTDQNGKQLNIRGENLTIRYHLREI